MAARRALDILKKVLLSFRTNWGLKLISLFFAVILWNYVIAEVNPPITITYSGIKVTFSSAEITQLKYTGFAVSGALPDKKINVTIALPRNEVSQLNKDDIKAIVDLSAVSSDGKKEVKIKVSSPRGTVKGQSMDTIPITVEKLTVRMVPVQFIPTGKLPDNYWMGSQTIKPSELKISGASTIVKKVEKAIVTLDLTNLTQEVSSALDYTLLDSKGNTIDPGGLEFDSPNSIVSLQVYPTKVVPIVYENSLNGEVARGYKVTDVAVYPHEITIAGPAGELESINALSLGRIDISGAKSNISVSKALDLPKDVYAVAGNTIQVLVSVDMIMTPVTLDSLPVSVTGLSPGLKVDTKVYATAVVTCPQLYEATVRRSKVHLYVDATGLEAGTHTLSIRAEFDPATGITSIDLKPTDVLVTITATAP